MEIESTRSFQDDLFEQNQSYIEEQHFVKRQNSNHSDVSIDFDDLIEKAENQEKQEEVQKLAEIMISSKRPKVYKKMDHKTKLEILEHLKNYSNKTKEELKKLKIDKKNKFYESLSKKYGVPASSISDLNSKLANNPEIVGKLEEVCRSEKGASGRGHVFQRRNSQITYPESIENKLVDWILGCHELGILITLRTLKKKAISLITPHSPNFKGSYPWVKKFLQRRGLSFKCTTTKIKKDKEEEKEIQEAFLSKVKRLILKYNIGSKYIINCDETPIYWEYLPRKVIHQKGSKIVPSIKTGFEYKRSTLMLACTAYGEFLRPSLILRRKREYKLNCPNTINMLLQKSDNGWTTEKTFIEWLKEVFIPYVGENQCLLLMDSFEAHISSGVRKFLKPYSNIHALVIPGGSTDKLQPLDMGINASFKAYCKVASLDTINMKMDDLYKEKNQLKSQKNSVKIVFLAGNSIFEILNINKYRRR